MMASRRLPLWLSTVVVTLRYTVGTVRSSSTSTRNRLRLRRSRLGAKKRSQEDRNIRVKRDVRELMAKGPPQGWGGRTSGPPKVDAHAGENPANFRTTVLTSLGKTTAKASSRGPSEAASLCPLENPQATK